MAPRLARKQSGAHRAQAIPVYDAQLATLVDAPPNGDEWLHELKYDGYRIGARIERGNVQLWSRRGKDWSAQFPEIVEATQQLKVQSALIDGEVAVLLPDGRTSFQALQNAFSGGRRDLVYFVFDLLFLDGRDLRGLRLEERKAELAKLLKSLKGKSGLRFSAHVEGDGAKVLAHACELGAEGIVSKRRDQPYRRGRNMGWLKSKCLKRQEFVIGGFTDPEGSRQGIGSMLVGYYDEDGRLVFAGKVGTGVGFTAKFCSDLRRRFERIEQKECPFAKRPPGWLGQHAHWLKPQLVAEIAFAEWTEGGNVRHGSFQGFREDKVARDVTREREMEVTSSASDADVVGSVQISHPERVIYPKLEFNKLDLANYYAEIAPWILPYVAGRPLTIVRCAEPIATENALREYCKFLPHTSGWHRFAGPNLRRVQIRELKKTGEYLVADSEAALVELAQGDIIEIHVWNSTFARLETPDRVVFDLDPAKGVPWKTLVHAALSLKDTLAELELESWVKTSGGKGLHVVVPFVPKLDWEQCFTASRAIAERLVAREPELFTLSFGKAARTSKILIDYKRNHRGAVAVAAYSARARPDGTVSVPVRWEDLKRLVPDKLTVSTVPKRVERLENDPWQGFWKSRQRLERALRALAK